MMTKLLAMTAMAGAAVMIAACEKPPEVATVGRTAPDFSLVDRKGRTWELSQLRGKVVLVNFWATWCPPCREEIPSLQNLYSAMPAGSFRMVSILYKDEPAAADMMAAMYGITFPILVDPDTRAGQAYGLTGVPETFIVDRRGVLREKFIGPRQWDSPATRQMLLKYAGR